MKPYRQMPFAILFHKKGHSIRIALFLFIYILIFTLLTSLAAIGEFVPTIAVTPIP